ncbi:MAG: D-glucuronyl C5-epimerase family protein [Candidatus Cloacimonadaceae bacterium]|jgi:hypothetical protein|nr:D-glucuronyl C5-epimerase family protein [Candidatus Cloacimonadota bacterium]MCB5254664.1 D-glucuronyl C5-epimerase family protein [Candidatus Cloacimonadota bacterium]MCK9178161.1 D-glucuronyl C5-epimerase family protein [Candidatus Cloacimonadota bacterium]MCK9242016.1 D-glucuronyl C5-epimerase family protein [Candidatus Cloacimonadota bacterium]MDY0127770.1 D-glucuronyl C5-epimerase family protein [Candidatus Cloacimonadaceae bacterium]
MKKKYIAISSALVTLLFISLIWQIAELKIYETVDAISVRILGRSINTSIVLDEEGIPMQFYSKNEAYYNPLFVARAAQEANLQRKLTGEDADFIKLTDWLLENLSETDSTALAIYDFAVPEYGQKAPWSSALAQSVVMLVLAERAAYQRDLEVYATASRTLYSLRPNAAGLSHAISDSSYWYMEYPAEKPYYVLNGMLSVLLNLHKYHELTHDPLALDLYEKGLNAVRQKLPEFDYHGYSYYDLAGNKAGRNYHQHHIKSLNKILSLENDPTLRLYRDRWQRSDGHPVIWQMMLNPRPLRILAFSLSFLAVWLIIYLLLTAPQRKEPDEKEHSSS